MNTPKTSKTPYIVITIVVIFLAIGYFYWSGTKPTDSLTLESGGDSQVVGSRVLRLLNEIDSLSIDSSFFSDKSYETLIDHSVVIPTLSVGRSNPFSPVPGVSNPSSSR
jgi:hypothetical protein